ncbi:MAG: hypothetical protein HQ446_01685 [Polaromonas sp.]|nr:hypothetical protein [Polaromonas sp.]
MQGPLHLDLRPEQIKKLSSHYLNEGRKQESWQIGEIQIRGRELRTTVSMRSIYTSGTDSKGFHLTIFSTLEFLSELMIVYAHAWAGLPEKSKEGWMVESSTKSVRAIRNPDAIHVTMKIASIKKLGENMLCLADYAVTDDQGGLFEVRLKGFLS